LIIDLFFLQPNSIKIINYSILSDLQYLLDHASLVIDISITKEFIQDKRHIIVKNSKEKKKLKSLFKNTQEYWNQSGTKNHSQVVNITRYFKDW